MHARAALALLALFFASTACAGESPAAYPDIPAIAETVPGYYNTGWWGIVAPAGTPRPIVEKLNGIMNRALATPELLQRFEKNGLEIATTTPRGFHDMLRADLKMWSQLIKDAKITVDVLP